MEHNTQKFTESDLFNGAIQETREKCAHASPLTCLDSSNPYFFTLPDNKVSLVPRRQHGLLYPTFQVNRDSDQLHYYKKIKIEV